MADRQNSNDPRGNDCLGARIILGLFPTCTYHSSKVNLTPWVAYEYINNGNETSWKVMSNLTMFAFRMTLPRGKHHFYLILYYILSFLNSTLDCIYYISIHYVWWLIFLIIYSFFFHIHLFFYLFIYLFSNIFDNFVKLKMNLYIQEDENVFVYM